MTQPTASAIERRCDRTAVKIVSIVERRISKDGKLYAYDGIEAAREIRELLIRTFSKKVKRP